MKLYSKTAGKELDVDIMQKEQDGQVLTVIKHASLMDIIYNQLNVCKDPDCIKMEDARPHSPYPVYKCTIWDKESNRCCVGIGSGKPETLPAGIPLNYADESASNRAFDRAAITFLQFPGRQLSEEEVGIFLPIDLEPAIEMPETSEDMPMANEPVPQIKNAPIKTQVADNFEGMNPPEEAKSEETTDKVEDKPIDANTAGARIITFGKYKNNPKTVKEIYEEDRAWVDKCLAIANPNPTIKDDIDALRIYQTSL